MNHFRGKYLNLMSNLKRFDSRYFLEDSLVAESTLTWVPIQTQIQIERPYKVTKTEVQLQDRVVNLDDLTLFEDIGVFTLEAMHLRPYELNPSVVTAMSFEVNPDVQVVERVNYTFLDAMSDVGGLGEVLAFMISFLLAIMNYNHT